MTTALLVRQAVRPDRVDEVAPLVVDHAREHAAAGIDALLPGEEVWTVTAFLERGAAGPALWWYVELREAGAAGWTDPAGAVRRSPLFEAGLDDLLATDPPARTFGSGRPDSRLVVHAGHPDRPARYRTGADGLAEPDGEWTPAVILAEDGPAAPPDVVFVRWRLRGGPATWFMRGFARLADWLDDDGWIEGKFTEWSEPVLEEESMWTETGFLERGRRPGPGARARGASNPDEHGESGTAVLAVMETEEMAGVTEGFYRTDNLVARVSEHVLGWVIEEPAQALRYEALRTDFEPLVHAVHPDRR